MISICVDLAFYYSQFHKTLPRSSLQMHWISVRFYEMGDSRIIRGLGQVYTTSLNKTFSSNRKLLFRLNLDL